MPGILYLERKGNESTEERPPRPRQSKHAMPARIIRILLDLKTPTGNGPSSISIFMSAI